MGQRFQVYVNYGKKDERLFGMHLQWCWGPFSIIRAHQLTNFIDGTRDDLYNPFGLGERGEVGGASFDGRREDLYLLKALTEINLTSSSIVEGHDLMQESDEWDKAMYEQGEIPTFPWSVRIDPLAQDNNDGFLVIQVGEDETKYAFCKDNRGFEPVNASEYLRSYQEDMAERPEDFRKQVIEKAERLDKMPLLSKGEMARIFERSYAKELNIERFEAPPTARKRNQSLSELVEEAKDRVSRSQSSPNKSTSTKREDISL